ncbi:MAG: substrate-binding domain-containing protein [Actinomycetota bacterium]
MRGGKRSGVILAGAASFLLLAAACSGNDSGTTTGSAGGDTPLSGNIVVSGSSTVEPISSLVAELFRENNPDVTINVDGPGTGDGFALFCNGETDISDASRPIADDEAATCKDAGIDYVELEIGLDGITVMTDPANDSVTCLNLGDLYALIGPEAEGFQNWSDAEALAAKVGGNGNYPDAPLDITGPGEESGTYDAFVELAGFEDTGVANGLAAEKAAVTRPDYQSSPNDNVIIQGIEGSDSSLGWVGFAFAQSAADSVKEIEIDGGSGCVAPTTDTIADGSYPLSRSLYIYVNTAKASENPALKAFVNSYVSDEGITAVDQAGYVALPADRIAATQSAWSGA